MGRIIVRSEATVDRFQTPVGTTLKHVLYEPRTETFDYVLEGDALPHWSPGVMPQQWSYSQVLQLLRRAEFT